MKDKLKNLKIALDDTCSFYLEYISYHPENEGQAKTFVYSITDRWYTETEIARIIGIKNVEAIKSKRLDQL